MKTQARVELAEIARRAEAKPVTRSGDLLDCPAGVFGDQRFGFASGAVQSGECGRIFEIAEGDADISQKTGSFDARHWGAGEASLESRAVHGKKFQEIRRLQVRAPVFAHQSSFKSESVPWAHRQAIIAAEDPVSYCWPELLWNRPLELDCQVRDAAASVELERSGDSAGGACREAPCAGTAAILLGRIRLNVNGRYDFAEEKPVA
jgi:hypothetical protein